MRSAALDRFHTKYTINPSTGCWEWNTTLKNGYGTFYFEGKVRRAHRVSYVLFVGDIPPGAEIDHVYDWGCRSKACANPDHLEAVPHVENVRRALPRRPAVNKTHCKHGHPLSGENLYLDADGHRSCRRCRRAASLRHRQRATA